MTLSIFAGEIEGIPVALAHTLLPSEQVQAAALLDQLTPRSFAMPDENGWLGVPIDPEMPKDDVVKWLSRAGLPVEWNPNIPRAKVEAVLGAKATNTLFEVSSAGHDVVELPD